MANKSDRRHVVEPEGLSVKVTCSLRANLKMRINHIQQIILDWNPHSRRHLGQEDISVYIPCPQFKVKNRWDIVLYYVVCNHKP